MIERNYMVELPIYLLHVTGKRQLSFYTTLPWVQETFPLLGFRFRSSPRIHIRIERCVKGRRAYWKEGMHLLEGALSRIIRRI